MTTTSPLALVPQPDPMMPPDPFTVMTDQAKSAVESMVRAFIKEDAAARRSEVRKAWQQRLFFEGQQHLTYDSKTFSWEEPNGDDANLPRYMDVYNIYAAHHRSFLTVLGMNWPGGNAVAGTVNSSVDISAAQLAEKMRLVVDQEIDQKAIQTEDANLFCTDGRTIHWIRLDKGELRITVHGVLESKVPILNRQMKQWGYLILSEERDQYLAKEDYPDFEKDISSEADGGEAQYERFARLNVLSGRRGMDSALRYICTEHNAWIRPARYRKAPENVRGELRELFPDGLHATIVSGKLVKCIAEVMESCCVAAWPVPGKGKGKSMLHDVVPIQGSYNDVKNMQREQAEYGIPATWVDGRAIDSEAISEQLSVPGAIHVINPAAGTNVENSVKQEDAMQLSPQVIAMGPQLLQDAEFIISDPPSLYGAVQEGVGDVYATNKLLSDKAKSLITPAWMAIQGLWAETYEIAIPLRAQQSKGEMSIDGPHGRETFDPAGLLDGKFTWRTDRDSAFPESTADQRAAFRSTMTDLVAAGDLATASHPDNMKLLQIYSGVPDIVILPANSRDKQLWEIEQLLDEAPVPNQNDPQWQQQAQRAISQGMQPPQPPMMSSVQVGKYDFHQFEADKCKEWLSSPACREQLQQGNHEGVQNIELHCDAHMAAISQAAQQAADAQKSAERKPMSITANYKDLPASIQDQAVQADGYTPAPEETSVGAYQKAQQNSAETQNTAASAQHKAVLAAKEAVAQRLPGTPDNAAPDQVKD